MHVRKDRSLKSKNETSRDHFSSYSTKKNISRGNGRFGGPSEMSNTAPPAIQLPISRKSLPAWHSAREQQRLLLARPIREGIQIKVRVSSVHCSYRFPAPYFVIPCRVQGKRLLSVFLLYFIALRFFLILLHRTFEGLKCWYPELLEYGSLVARR